MEQISNLVVEWIRDDPDRLAAAEEAWSTDDEGPFTEFLFDEIADEQRGLIPLVHEILEYALSAEQIGRILFG